MLWEINQYNIQHVGIAMIGVISLMRRVLQREPSCFVSALKASGCQYLVWSRVLYHPSHSLHTPLSHALGGCMVRMNARF